MPFLPDSLRKTFLVILAALLFATALPTFLAVFFEYRQSEEAAASRMRQVVRLQRAYLDRWSRLHVLEEIRSLTGLKSVQARDYPAMLDDFLAVSENRTDLLDLVYVNRYGRPAVSTAMGVVGETELDLTDRDYYQAARRGEEMVASLVVSRVRDEPILIFSVPLENEGIFDGLLFGSVRMTQIAALSQSQTFGKTGRFRLFDGTGRPFEAKGGGEPFFDASTTRLNGSLLTKVDDQGRPSLLFVKPAGFSDLFIGALMDMGEVHDQALQMKGVTVASLLFLGGLGTLLFFLLFHRLSRAHGIVAADLAAAEGGDYTPLPEESLRSLPLELRRIAQAVNDLKGTVSLSLETLRDTGLRDPLTGLHNRLFFEESLRELADGREDPLSIVMCDINGLKLINDGLGHLWGDRLIEKAARVLRQSARPGDVVARIGGDEFALIFSRSSEARERAFEEKLLQSLGDDEDDLPLYMAWGIAQGEAKRRSLESIVQEADERMYARKESRREKTQQAILDVFLSQIQRREKRRISHMARCRSLMEAFLQSRPGFDEPFRRRMARLASLHDIGIIAVDGAILSKEGPLDADQWRAVQVHPEAGSRIASAIPHLADLAEAILHHHQRWDGQGYPLRKNPLAGEAIPLESRLMNLVDAYESMTHRTYRAPLTHREAIDEIERCSGSQFDPQWARAFVAFLKTWNG